MKPGSPATPPDTEGRLEQILQVKEDVDAYWCGGECVRIAKAVGFDGHSLWELSIVVRELATNLVKFAGQGVLTLRHITEPQTGIEIVVEDDGPGIEDVEAAKQDGYSEGRFLAESDFSQPRRGLGMGLGAVDRLMDTLTIENRPQGGLRIVARRWLPTPKFW